MQNFSIQDIKKSSRFLQDKKAEKRHQKILLIALIALIIIVHIKI